MCITKILSVIEQESVLPGNKESLQNQSQNSQRILTIIILLFMTIWFIFSTQEDFKQLVSKKQSSLDHKIQTGR